MVKQKCYNDSINKEKHFTSEEEYGSELQTTLLKSLSKISFSKKLIQNGIQQLSQIQALDFSRDIQASLESFTKSHKILLEVEKYLILYENTNCKQELNDNIVKCTSKDDCSPAAVANEEFDEECGIKIEPECSVLEELDGFTDAPDNSDQVVQENKKIIKQKISPRSPLICNICKEGFPSRKEIQIHKRTHKPFKCEICPKGFATKSQLKAHNQIHSSVKSYKCDVCDKEFISASNLYTHKFVHAERKFQCEMCSNTFLRKSDLQKHMFIHSGEKPFKCEYCSLSTAFKSTLIEHVRTHTGEKPYKCHLCPKSFRVKTGLNAHLRRHAGIKPYKCDVCHKDFDSKSHLQTHTRIHTGEKPFDCDLCKKSFTRKANLREHMNIHKKDRTST